MRSKVDLVMSAMFMLKPYGWQHGDLQVGITTLLFKNTDVTYRRYST